MRRTIKEVLEDLLRAEQEQTEVVRGLVAEHKKVSAMQAQPRLVRDESPRARFAVLTSPSGSHIIRRRRVGEGWVDFLWPSGAAGDISKQELERIVALLNLAEDARDVAR